MYINIPVLVVLYLMLGFLFGRLSWAYYWYTWFFGTKYSNLMGSDCRDDILYFFLWPLSFTDRHRGEGWSIWDFDHLGTAGRRLYCLWISILWMPKIFFNLFIISVICITRRKQLMRRWSELI